MVECTIEERDSKFPDVWLLAADNNHRKNRRTTARSLLRQWEDQIGHLRHIEPQDAADPSENTAGRHTGEIVSLDARGLLHRQTTAVRPWSRIDLLLRNGELDRALVKLAGVDGCADEAKSLTYRLQFLYDQFKLGKYTHQEVEAQEIEITAEIRRILDETPYNS
jgi:hypothetical protein